MNRMKGKKKNERIERKKERKKQRKRERGWYDRKSIVRQREID